MPLNEGVDTLRVVSQHLMDQSAEAIDDAVQHVTAEIKRQEAAQRTMTDIAFRAWHEERYDEPDRGSLLQARREFDIVIPTEMPIDQWMNRIRGNA